MKQSAIIGGWPKQTVTMKIRSGQAGRVKSMLKRLGL